MILWRERHTLWLGSWGPRILEDLRTRALGRWARGIGVLWRLPHGSKYITIAARLMHAGLSGDLLRAPVKLIASAPPMQGSGNGESCVAQSRPVAELFYFVHR